MKLFASLLTLLLSLGLLLNGCSSSDRGSSSEAASSPEPDKSYHKITAAQAKEMMDAGGVIIVDVRTAEEYAEKHIPGAILVPNESIADEPPSALPDPEAVLLVYCRSGVRSRQASDKLVDLGYTNIYDFGGIIDWPYETVSGQ